MIIDVFYICYKFGDTMSYVNVLEEILKRKNLVIIL